MTCLLAGWRCRPRPPAPAGGIGRARRERWCGRSAGSRAFSAQTLEAAFATDYPRFELLFCVARADDPVVPMVQAAIAAHPAIAARLLVGDDPISVNPKLNNMVKGWREATSPWIAFIDSNVLAPPAFVTQLVATWRADTGAVSAPPVGCRAEGLWSHLECAFLNTYEARWQYVVEALGMGFAQGKTLFYRRADLDRSGLRELASDPAEDAATTKMVRRMGLRVRLAPPSPQPLGRRTLADVWGRQLRWARLRRMTFPAEFLPEILSGSAVPVCCLGAGRRLCELADPRRSSYRFWRSGGARRSPWRRPAAGRVTWQTPLALLIRDLLAPVIWVGAFTGRSFTWKGTAVTMEPRRRTAGEEAST